MTIKKHRSSLKLKAGYGFVPNGVEEKNLYFYHPDHLGSSSYITDKEGKIIQHTEYMAFGEVLFDEHSVSKMQPYLFNGKELDYETGLYYYGARYYDPKTSIFLNVDPLVEKTGTPYAYVNNNPVNLIDPTGMEAEAVCCPPIPAPIPLLPPPILHNPEQGVIITGIPISLPSKEDIKKGFNIVKHVAIFYITSKIVEIEQGFKNVQEGFDKTKELWNRVQNSESTTEKGKYGHLKEPKKVGEGLKTTPAQRKRILEENKKQNNGQLISDGDGRLLNMPSRNVKGQKADMNQAEIDHIQARSKKGSNSNTNLRVLSKEENLKKGNK